MVEEIIQELDLVFPNRFPRQVAFAKMTMVMGKSPLTARSLANLDAKRVGPGGKLMSGRIMYEKENFLLWLRAYLEKGNTHFADHETAGMRSNEKQDV